MALAPSAEVKAIIVPKGDALVAEVDAALLAAVDIALVLPAGNGSIGVNHDPRITEVNQDPISVEANQIPVEESVVITILNHPRYVHVGLITRLIVIQRTNRPVD